MSSERTWSREKGTWVYESLLTAWDMRDGDARMDDDPFNPTPIREMMILLLTYPGYATIERGASAKALRHINQP
jgi:hypothetical protein